MRRLLSVSPDGFKDSANATIRDTSTGVIVANVTSVADAQLFASAPVLLELLRRARRRIPLGEFGLRDEIDAALADAGVQS